MAYFGGYGMFRRCKHQFDHPDPDGEAYRLKMGYDPVKHIEKNCPCNCCVSKPPCIRKKFKWVILNAKSN